MRLYGEIKRAYHAELVEARGEAYPPCFDKFSMTAFRFLPIKKSCRFLKPTGFIRSFKHG